MPPRRSSVGKCRALLGRATPVRPGNKSSVGVSSRERSTAAFQHDCADVIDTANVNRVVQRSGQLADVCRLRNCTGATE